MQAQNVLLVEDDAELSVLVSDLLVRLGIVPSPSRTTRSSARPSIGGSPDA
jgi:hypothetical protein